MLEVQDLCSGYQETIILRDINFAITRGQIVNLLGPNGAGKSTLLNTLIGVLTCTRGRIFFKDEDITTKGIRDRVEMGLALVPEGRHLFPELTVQQNLEVAAMATRRGEKRKEENFELIYQIFPRLKERAKQRAETLSGGEQQMLTIARALMTNPDMLMLDEPSQGLAPLVVNEIYEVISHLNKQMGVTILISEQQLTRALDISDFAIVLEFGKVVYKGPIGDIISELKKIYVG